MRSIWWISEVPGSSGLWASSSARMQPMALRSGGRAGVSRRSLSIDPHCAPSSAGPASAPSCPPLTTCQCWWSASSSPAAARALGTCAGDSTSSRGPRWSRCEGSPRRIAPSQRSPPSPERDDFGGHRLRRHPVGARQSKVGCDRDSRSGERKTPRPTPSRSGERAADTPAAVAGSHLSSRSLCRS